MFYKYIPKEKNIIVDEYFLCDSETIIYFDLLL